MGDIRKKPGFQMVHLHDLEEEGLDIEKYAREFMRVGCLKPRSNIREATH